ncbi:MAG: hypothetical protein KKF41_05200 [Actinobacteria bacterium]|nr:hypothetical protein [Actinomycetota bacterium]MBU2686964.1 hypothetical protein [Actinomycetota bacterium]
MAGCTIKRNISAWIVVAVAVCLLPVPMLAGTARADTWSRIAGADPVSRQNAPASVVCMAEYQDHLYAGTGSTGEVWRYDGAAWELVNVPGFGGRGNDSITAMATAGSHLYVGVGNEATGCEVWRTSALGGPPFTDWRQVSLDRMGQQAGNDSIAAMAVLDSTLYAGTSGDSGCQVFRYDGPGAADWTMVNHPGFGDHANSGIPAMAVFDSRLHAGTENASGGCQVWRLDGLEAGCWTQVGHGGFGDPTATRAASMAAFGPFLYVGTSGCRLLRTAGAGNQPYTDWEPVSIDGLGNTGNAEITSLGAGSCDLYAGTTNPSGGCEIHRTAASGRAPFADWTRVNEPGFGSKENAVNEALLLKDGMLYAAAGNGMDVSEVWVTGPVEEAPRVTSMSPVTASNGGAVLAGIRGSGFRPGAAVTIEKPAESPIAGTGVTVMSPERLTCVLDITDASPGTWDVRVVNDDGQCAVLPAALRITGTLSDDSTWYLAEGTTAWGFATRLSIENPNSVEVGARVTYLTNAGPLPGGDFQLPPRSQCTINPAETLGERDFSTKVECLDGRAIYVDRTMTWTGRDAAAPGAHSSMGVRAPASAWYLPEGSSAWGFESWLLIQNPNPGPAECEITYMLEDAAPRVVRRSIPADSRASFNMADEIGVANSSIRVVSDRGVIAERAMYRHGRREGHSSVGATAPSEECFLAEGTTAWGFDTFLLVQNPGGSPADVTVTYMTDSGPVEQPTFTMPPGSRKTVDVGAVLPGRDFSIAVRASAGIVAERAIYWDSWAGQACHDSIGVSSPHRAFHLPDGEAADDCDTYTLVQNPNPRSVTVRVSYLTPDGAGNRTFTDTIWAGSRKTYCMADRVSGRASIEVTCLEGGGIVVERSMYWAGRAAGTDTIGGYTDQ